VGDAHRGVGHVDVLASGPARAVGVDAKVLLLDLDLDVLVDLGPDEDGRERGVAAGRGVEGADAHEPVDPDLGREIAVRVLPVHEHGRALDAGLLAGLDVREVALEALAVAPPEVHPQQHLRPVLALGPPRAGVDRQDGVDAVVLATQHLLELGALDHGLEPREAGLQVLVHVLAGGAPLEEHAGVVLLAPEPLQEVEVALDALAALEDLLRGVLPGPEIGGRHLPLEPGELALQAAFVKDSRGCPRPSRPGRRSAG
jgi:hypothetical protein